METLVFQASNKQSRQDFVNYSITGEMQLDYINYLYIIDLKRSFFSLNNIELVRKLNDLIQDPNFLKLKSLQSQSNLFEIVAASHTEMWHSAFVKWLLDPSSSLGLGVFPLQRFLYTVRYEGMIQEGGSLLEFNLEDIENSEKLKLKEMQFETEYTDKGLKRGRLDIIGACEECRITIENKITAREIDDQTVRYYEYLSETKNFTHDVMVFLSPDETRSPSCEHFIHITYEQLCDHVLLPCSKHPDLTEKNRFLIEQYLANLGKPLKGGKVMAKPNKELCQEIYKKHKEVLDEIYVAVNDAAPIAKSSRNNVRMYNLPFSRLVEQGIISLEDTLQAKYKGKIYTANLARNDKGSIIIQIENECYTSPSTAATSITNGNINGWTFWDVIDANQDRKGSLAELRKQIPDDAEE